MHLLVPLLHEEVEKLPTDFRSSHHVSHHACRHQRSILNETAESIEQRKTEHMEVRAKKGPRRISAQSSLHKVCRLYCGFGLPSILSPAFFISCPVSSVPVFTALPVFFAATLVSWPVLSATFSVPFAVSFATTLVSWPVFSAPFLTSVATS